MPISAREATLSQAGCKSSQRGLVLVVVLWIVATLALLVAALNASVRTGTAVVGNEVNDARRLASIDAGIEIAAARLKFVEAGMAWRPDGRPHELEFAGARLVLTIFDAAGRIDLNKADIELLAGLLAKYTDDRAEAESMAARIVDWRDKDSERTTGGAEIDDYTKAGSQRMPADGPFISVTQLRHVLGMRHELYRHIAPLITVFGRSGRINPATAPRAVLLSLPGISAAEVDQVMALRANDKPNLTEITRVLAPARKWLNARPGPAYIIRVSIIGANGRPVRSREVIVVFDIDKGAPYRVVGLRRPILPPDGEQEGI